MTGRYAMIFILLSALIAGPCWGGETAGFTVKSIFKVNSGKKITMNAFTARRDASQDMLIISVKTGSQTINEPAFGGEMKVDEYRKDIYILDNKGKMSLLGSVNGVLSLDESSAGDIDNDGSDDIMFFSRKGQVILWKGGKTEKVKLPRTIGSAVTYDIDGDGKNELVALSTAGDSTMGSKLSLSSWKWNGKTFTLIWEGKPSYLGGDGGADQLLDSGRFLGSTKVYALLQKGQSDVRPSKYELIGCSNGKLAAEHIIDQKNNTVPESLRRLCGKKPCQFIGDINPLIIDNKSYLLGSLMGATDDKKMLALAIPAGNNFTLKACMTVPGYCSAFPFRVKGIGGGILIVHETGALEFLKCSLP